MGIEKYNGDINIKILKSISQMGDYWQCLHSYLLTLKFPKVNACT